MVHGERTYTISVGVKTTQSREARRERMIPIERTGD
jgi:hypothetical protein